MHPSVHAAWKLFSEPLEGREYGMYLDVFGLVTCGVGNLIDSVSEAQKLPWKRDSDGGLATPAEVRAAWTALKARQDLRNRSTRHARALTGLHLVDEDIDALVEKKLASNEAHITGWLPNFPNIPADAQLAILSMAWAVGPAFNTKFPNFTRAALAGKWWEAAAHGKIKEEDDRGTPREDDDIPNPGVIPRNKANKLCFENASNVVANQADPRVLHWPNKFQPGLVMPEDSAPPERSADTNRPATLEDAAAVRAIATEAATSAFADNLLNMGRDAHRQMAIDPNDESGDEEPTLLDPKDEDTAVDGKGNV
jgi:hypothetical protein